MVVDSGKATYKTEAVSEVEEDVVSIHISPTTYGPVFISEIFIGISEILIGVIFRETVNNMVAIDAAMQRLVSDVIRTMHPGEVEVVED